ncbi:unnamed protein product, partial [Brassica rapa subsp. trilocularis]
EEIKYFKYVVKAHTHEKKRKFVNLSSIVEKLKLSPEECKSLKREVLILNE